MPEVERYSPETRRWTDVTGRTWYICDLCDGALLKEALFHAPVQPGFADPGGFYCPNCARGIVTEWETKWPDMPSE